MNDSPTRIATWIEQARAGDNEALGQLLDRYRSYLRLLALRQIDRRLGQRVDASDVVQQTCLSAHRQIERFDGASEEAFLAWLRQIQRRNVLNVAREHLGTQQRSVGREQDLSASGVEHLAADESFADRPSQRLMLTEQSARLAALMSVLPEDQQETVRLRFLEGLSLVEIAERIGRSRDATAGLLKRGLQKLRDMVGDDSFFS